MTNKERNYVRSTIENEGFDYTFIHYSNFEDIKDKKFHELRQAYTDAVKEMKSYIELDD
jgi:hypothetical protein